MNLTLHIRCLSRYVYTNLSMRVEFPWDRVPVVGEEIELRYGYGTQTVERVVWTPGGCHLWLSAATDRDAIAELKLQGFQE